MKHQKSIELISIFELKEFDLTKMSDIKVIKKDGKVVEFKPKKIFKACKAAGTSKEIADKVTKLVVEDLHKIKSKTIREKTLERLKELDKDAADNWIKHDIEHTKYEDNNNILKF